MSDKDPKTVRDELARKNKDQSTKKLTFDPTTGELVIKSDSEAAQTSGDVVVDQIYRDGFFCDLL